MRCLLQRVQSASVCIHGELTGEIQRGLLVFVGFEQADTPAVLPRMIDKVLGYRVFGDAEGRMNQSLASIRGDLLVVSQFTLAADTRKGARPSFSSAAAPELARVLYDRFVEQLGLYCKETGIHLATGTFGADMQVALVNDGPVTFMLEVR
jgi:D-tyrosyl-tRNA(Tyr) deacylase